MALIIDCRSSQFIELWGCCEITQYTRTYLLDRYMYRHALSSPTELAQTPLPVLQTHSIPATANKSKFIPKKSQAKKRNPGQTGQSQRRIMSPK
jgi:hypothetical protein